MLVEHASGVPDCPKLRRMVAEAVVVLRPEERPRFVDAVNQGHRFIDHVVNKKVDITSEV